MLREADNSMMAIASRSDRPKPVNRVPRGRMPVFEAATVQGMSIPQQEELTTAAPQTADQTLTISAAAPFVTPEISSAPAVPSLSLRPEHWRQLERGLRQRFEAVHACLDEIVRHSHVPAYLQDCGFIQNQIQSKLAPILGTTRSDIAWTWFGSTDVHLTPDGQLTVFDHNFSVPTGLDCLVNGKGNNLIGAPQHAFLSVPAHRGHAGVTVVLTPGHYASTGPGNEFIANALNAVEARSMDLMVRGDAVYLRSGAEQVRVSTIVRRIDDDLLDPNCFRPDSLVGVPGLVRVWKKGGVDVLSPPSVGLANCRTFGRMIPRMIVEFLGEEPLLETAEVLDCEDSATLKHVLSNADRFAIRTNDPLHPARPFFGRHGLASEFAELLVRLRKNPAAYVARPLLPDGEDPGVNLRLFATMSHRFRLLPAALPRACQPDGGAAYRQ